MSAFDSLTRIVDMLDRHAEERERPIKKEEPVYFVGTIKPRNGSVIEADGKVDTSNFQKIKID